MVGTRAARSGHGGAARRGRRTAGFTLVELLVVIVIVGLAASVAVLAMPERGGSLSAEAERFAARAAAARDRAILESRPASLAVSPAGYTFSHRAGGEWREAERHAWDEATALEASAAGTRFDSTGLAEPLHLVLRRGDRRVSVAIGTDGRVAIQR